MKNKILLLSFAVCLAGCSHLAVTIPTPIIETPEISGNDKAGFGGSGMLQAGHRYEATQDASARPPSLTSPDATNELSTLAVAHFDFLKRIRIGAGGDPINGGLFAKAQIQILGDGQANAKSGNFSMSIFGHAGTHTPDKDGDQNGTFGPGGNPWKAEIQTDWYDFGASIGYRVSDSATVFVGAAKQLTLYQTSIDHTQGAAPNNIYQTNDRAEANKAMMGLVFGGSGHSEIFVAGDYTDIRYHKTAPLYIASASLGLSLNFK